jgi:hypothetical protein
MAYMVHFKVEMHQSQASRSFTLVHAPPASISARALGQGALILSMAKVGWLAFPGREKLYKERFSPGRSGATRKLTSF